MSQLGCRKGLGGACRGLVWIGLAAILVAAGCGPGRRGGSASLRSTQTGDELSASLPTRVYTPGDSNTADLYLTDLPPEVWTSGADVSDMAGMIVHVHMFIRPRAGRTPIESTASTASVRVLVLARGEIGVYGGGGFFLHSGDVGDATFGGSLSGGTLRLVHATPGFDDRLGPSKLTGAFSGRRDAETSRALARALRTLIAESEPVGVEAAATPASPPSP